MQTNEYQNIKMEGLNKPQLETIVLNPRFVDKIKVEDIKDYHGHRVFIKIPEWLRKANNLTSFQIYGRITKITDKAIMLNYSNMFIPISQIQEVLVRRNTPRHKQTLLTRYEEVAPT